MLLPDERPGGRKEKQIHPLQCFCPDQLTKAYVIADRHRAGDPVQRKVDSGRAAGIRLRFSHRAKAVDLIIRGNDLALAIKDIASIENASVFQNADRARHDIDAMLLGKGSEYLFRLHAICVRSGIECAVRRRKEAGV